MFQKLLLISFMLLAGPAQAFSPRLICTTYHPTTSYGLIDEGDYFELQVMHHHGVQFMPVHKGLITASDLPLIAENSKVLTQLGDRFVVKFEKSECKLQNAEWTCSQKKPSTIGTVSVEGVWFTVSKRYLETSHVKYHSYEVNFSITKNGRSYSSPMEYPADQCEFIKN